ncbi:hypothetical protein [Nocardia anaemiae]|uniref:hypothetical protein n=1 Tax=Nocardia anaemiae TaxID=263910 RepID=UPI000AC31209|nr:hypothetical protein [Nocardia anaemiae]
MNRIAISMTMLIPPLFLLSLALAQPVSAAPPNGGAAVALPWGPLAPAGPDGAAPGSEVVFGECTGSACSTPRPGNGLARVPDPLRVAPLATDIARVGGSGSASSLPRVFGDLLSRLLDLVQQAPLPLLR